MMAARLFWPEAALYTSWFLVAWAGGALAEALAGGRRGCWSRALSFAARYFLLALLMWFGLRYWNIVSL